MLNAPHIPNKSEHSSSQQSLYIALTQSSSNASNHTVLKHRGPSISFQTIRLSLPQPPIFYTTTSTHSPGRQTGLLTFRRILRRRLLRSFFLLRRLVSLLRSMTLSLLFRKGWLVVVVERKRERREREWLRVLLVFPLGPLWLSPL